MKRWTVRVRGWRLGRWGEAEWVSHHWTRAGAELRLRLNTARINSVGGGYTTALSRDVLAPCPPRENLLTRIKAARAK